MTAQVQVEGLADLARELKRIDPALNKQLRLVNKTVSDKVVTAGRPAIQGLPSPGGSVATAGLTARATPTQATVVLAGRNRTIRANVFGAQSHWVWGHKKSGRGPWQPWLGKSDGNPKSCTGSALPSPDDRHLCGERVCRRLCGRSEGGCVP